MSKTLSEMFQAIAEHELDLDVKVTAIKIYIAQDDKLGFKKVMSVVAAKEMDPHRLVHVAMTDRRYPRYKDCDVVDADIVEMNGDVFKVWISK